MGRPRNLFWLAVPLIVIGSLLMIFIDPGSASFIVGYLIGTIFGHATLASAWTTFGPFPLILRFPLALLWLTLTAGCIALNVWLHRGPAEISVLLGVCVFCQYAVLQVPLWILALSTGVRLRSREIGGLSSNPREYQFGIRQLMIFTAIVAVIFGLGRLVATLVGPKLDFAGSPGLSIFIFLVVAAIVITLPLLLAGLLPRYWWQAVLAVLMFIGVATAFELPMQSAFRIGNGPGFLDLVWINAFTSAWILAMVLLARVSGYRLVGRSAIGNLPRKG